MNVLQTGARPGLTRWRNTLLLAIAAVACLATYAALAPTAHASGQEFCSNAWLDRYGQPNDNCAANDKHYNYAIVFTAREHSVCGSVTTNTSKSGLVDTWDCTPGSYESMTNWVSPKILTNGIVRNNTAADTNHSYSNQNWCANYNCS